MPTKLGPHVLRGTEELPSYIQARPAVIKLVGGWGMADSVPEGVLVIGRKHQGSYDAQLQYNTDKTPLQAAEQFVQDQLDTYQSNSITYWEGHNEPVWSTEEEMAWYAQFEIERMKLMADLGYKCVLGNFATGTPPLELWPAFLPAIEAGLEHEAILGLHEYSCPWMWWMTGKHQLDPNEDEGDEGWTTLRYRKVYRQYLIPNDTVIPLVITEGGIDPLVNPKPPGTPNAPWKGLGQYWEDNHDGPVEYTGNRNDYYFKQLVWYDKELQKDPYVIGMTLFTWGSWGGTWKDFEVTGTSVADKIITYTEGDPADDFTYYEQEENMPDIALCQRDPRWVDHNLGEEQGGETIGSHGCLLCSVGMVLKSIYDTDIRADNLNDVFARDGRPFVYDDLLMIQNIPELFSVFDGYLRVDNWEDLDWVQSLLSKGYKVILRYGNSRHFVYLKSIDNGVATVIDPWTGKERTDIGRPTGIRALHVKSESDVLGVHGAPILSPPEDMAYWIRELSNMGVSWFKMLDSGSDRNYAWANELVSAGINPIVRLYQSQQCPDELNAELVSRVPRFVDIGVEHFEVMNEPNLDVEWKSGYEVDYHNKDLVERVAESWLSSALQIVRKGGRSAFPAMAPTERNGGVNPRYSSVKWAEEILLYLGRYHRRTMVSLLSDGSFWLAVHSARFNKPMNYNPWSNGKRDDMCLRGYEIYRSMIHDIFGVWPVTISTEGGVYEPNHLRDLGWEPDYNEQEWGQLVVEMFDFLEGSGLTAMCPWHLTDENVSDSNWRGNGWYEGKTPRSPAIKLKEQHGQNRI